MNKSAVKEKADHVKHIVMIYTQFPFTVFRLREDKVKQVKQACTLFNLKWSLTFCGLDRHR